MDERQAPFWITDGTLRLEVSALEDPTPATFWVDGEVVDRAQVARPSDLRGRAGRETGWHAVVLEVPLGSSTRRRPGGSSWRASLSAGEEGRRG